MADESTTPTTPGTGATAPPAAGTPIPKTPEISAVASLLLPGVGQILNGQIKKGLIILVGWLAAFVILFLFNVIGTIIVSIISAGVLSGLGIICCADYFLPLLINVYAAYEAYTVAKQINAGVAVQDWLEGSGKA